MWTTAPPNVVSISDHGDGFNFLTNAQDKRGTLNNNKMQYVMTDVPHNSKKGCMNYEKQIFNCT